jgi:hypothetical protein
VPISDAFYGQPWPAFCITTGRGQVPRGVPKRSRGTAPLVQGSRRQLLPLVGACEAAHREALPSAAISVCQ